MMLTLGSFTDTLRPALGLKLRAHFRAPAG